MLKYIKISLLIFILTIFTADLNANDRISAADLTLLAEQRDQAGIPLVINEFMASNSSCIQDSEGQYDDWIEIYNYGTDAIDTGGMYLTDDLSAPTKWQIPDNNPAATTISAGGYLLIWADNKTIDAGLHANFKLDADGEEIGLFDADGSTLIDSVTFGEQMPDISYGRYPDADDYWRFFGVPSPGEENIAVYEGFVSDVQFSQERGFYDTPFSVTLATDTKDALIYYTLDGSEPYQTGPRGAVATGNVYTGPIQINGTTYIRAAAIKGEWKPSNIITHTYIFLDDVIRQPANPAGFPTRWGSRAADYAMDQRVVNDPAYSSEIKDDLKSTPSVCIVIDNADFFGSGGIYANPTQYGDQWEQAASIEWIDPSTGDDFGVNAGLRIHGGPYSRGQNPKNALRVIFRGEYGPTRLEYPLFPDTDVTTFNVLALRSIWNYSWTGHSGMSGSRHADYLRDAFARDTVRDMGNLTPYGRPIQVYINGLYWGLYIMTERPDERFVSDHLGGDEEDYDMLEAPSGFGGSTTMQIVSGGEQARQAWNAVFSMADTNLATSQAYQAMQANIDIPSMIDYMLMIYYVGSRDAPVFLGDQRTPRNFYAVRLREPAGPFIFVPWDTEWALEYPTENRVNLVGVWNPHYLINKLKANPDFKMLLADQIHRRFHNGGALTLESTTQRYMARADEIYGAIVGESARWGDEPRPSRPYTRDVEWVAEVDRLVNEYFSVRTDIVMGQLRQAGLYPSISAPEFYINDQSQHGGYIESSDLFSIIANSGTIWYTLDGSEPRIPSSGGGSVDYTTLVPENAAKRVLVPSVANGGNRLGNTPAGFEVTYFKANIAVGNLRTAELVISNPTYQSNVVTEVTPVINYLNNGANGHFANDNPFPSTTIGNNVDDFVILATGRVQIPQAGYWTFGVNSDDGFGIELTNGTDNLIFSYPNPRAAGDTLATFNILEPGLYDIRLVFYERGGDSALELFAARGRFTTFNSFIFHLVGDVDNGGLGLDQSIAWFSNQFDDSTWSSGTGGIGYEAGSGYENYISLDLEDQMYGVNTTCYIRIPLTFNGSPDNFNILTLKVRYDDGFIAYLNGVEVARRNFTGEPAWDSIADTIHDDSEAVNFENIDISANLNNLQTGSNILAIHGLNASTTSSDFLISVELVAGTISSSPVDEIISPEALKYNGPVTLTESVHVKARVLSGGTWSALNEAVFAVGPDAAH